ncbi:hypothetical protein OIB37_30165 [Streptomyces sp. NBC_00820]|uniref:hypothetical protein n=1 Tax=Streptomyces sp. NBC_00820 TaxID=2975842 RepID=UPI002ED635BD|nr:hypothetical protein OIB37_30165 [Streptomyces sp. NBC_00820]
MSASPAVRGLRAAVFAAVCVLLAAAGHGLAMGVMPRPGVDGVAFLAVFGLGWLLGGRERSLPGIGAVMLATQGALHAAFDAARPGAPHAPVRMNTMRMADTHGHVMHGHAMDAMHVTPAGTAHVHALAAHATVAHLLAALIASWWLRRGEAALWGLLRRAGALLPGLAAWWGDVPLPVSRPAPLRFPADADLPRRLPLRHGVSRRGPPAPIPYSA